MKSIEELIKLLEVRFPNAWFKHGQEFGANYGQSVWTGEDSYVDKKKEIRMFDYNNMGADYQFGAHIKLCQFVEKHNYFVECYDGGTFFIWQD